MTENAANVYKTAREFACMQRVQAAFELGLSASSLKDYETGVRNVPDGVALAMSQLYRTPWLRVQHLEKNVVFCDIFGLVPPMEDEAVSLLRLQKEIADVVELFPQMIAQAAKKVRYGSSVIKECVEAAGSLLAVIGLAEKETPREQNGAFRSKLFTTGANR